MLDKTVLRGQYAEFFARTELYPSVRLGKERVITSHAYIHTRLEFSAALANQNVAGPNHLTVTALESAKLRIAVATIFC